MSNVRVKNPHSILAALKHRPGEVVSIVLPAGPNPGDAWAEIERLAKKHRVKMQSAADFIESQRSRDAGSGQKGRPAKGGRPGPKGGRDQGRPGPQSGSRDLKDGRISAGEAVVKEKQPVPVERLFTKKPGDKNESGLWLALDTLQDPHNVGAIFRTASFFGVKGLLLTEDRSAPLSGTVYDVSSGGVEAIPFAKETNLKRCLALAKEAGLWVLGTSEHAETSFTTIGPDRAWLLVLGNEEKGMRRLTAENCDMTVQVPPKGEVTSLNVSVAAGILIAKLS